VKGIIEKRAPRVSENRNTSTSLPAYSSPSQLADRLLAYLRVCLKTETLTFTREPDAVADGWETYICRFQLRGDGLPVEWQEPLILRVHVGPDGIPRVRHEAGVHAHLFNLQYPVPRVLVHELNHQLLTKPSTSRRPIFNHGGSAGDNDARIHAARPVADFQIAYTNG
jgi:hypothetical protein